MSRPAPTIRRCAVYTRVSTDHRLEQDFNSLDAQREAAEAYVRSQAGEGWKLVRNGVFSDGGFSGGDGASGAAAAAGTGADARC